MCDIVSLIYRIFSTHFTFTCAKHIFINKISYRITSYYNYLPCAWCRHHTYEHFSIFCSFSLSISTRLGEPLHESHSRHTRRELGSRKRAEKHIFRLCVRSVTIRESREIITHFYLAYYSVFNEIRSRVVVEKLFSHEKAIKLLGMHPIRLLASAIIFLSAALCQQDLDVNCEYRWGGSICDCHYSDEVINFLSFFFLGGGV